MPDNWTNKNHWAVTNAIGRLTYNEHFEKWGTYDPGLSDHCMVYWEMSEKIRKRRPRLLTFRRMKYTDFDQLNDL